MTSNDRHASYTMSAEAFSSCRVGALSSPIVLEMSPLGVHERDIEPLVLASSDLEKEDFSRSSFISGKKVYIRLQKCMFFNINTTFSL